MTSRKLQAPKFRLRTLKSGFIAGKVDKGGLHENYTLGYYSLHGDGIVAAECRARTEQRGIAANDSRDAAADRGSAAGGLRVAVFDTEALC